MGKYINFVIIKRNKADCSNAQDLQISFTNDLSLNLFQAI